jgi:hypothetical protein
MAHRDRRDACRSFRARQETIPICRLWNLRVTRWRFIRGDTDVSIGRNGSIRTLAEQVFGAPLSERRVPTIETPTRRRGSDRIRVFAHFYVADCARVPDAT